MPPIVKCNKTEAAAGGARNKVTPQEAAACDDAAAKRDDEEGEEIGDAAGENSDEGGAGQPAALDGRLASSVSSTMSLRSLEECAKGEEDEEGSN
jgi:hypothetical protein